MDRMLVAILVIALVSWTISFYIHHPDTVKPFGLFGLKYSDIVHGVSNPRFSPKYRKGVWYTGSPMDILCSGRNPLPYIDYRFEYPPIIAYVYMASTYIAMETTGICSDYESMYTGFIGVIYIVNSIAILVAHMATTVVVYKLLRDTGFPWKYILLYLLSPSLIVYLIYNWDIFTALFLALSIHAMRKKNPLLAGVYVALATGVKLLPATIAITVLLIYMQRRRMGLKTMYERKWLMGYGATLLALFTPFLAMSPHGFIDSMNVAFQWYCENCVYQVIEPDIFSPAHKAFSFTAIVFIAILASYIYSRLRLYRYETLVYSITVLTIALNYISSPQMLLTFIPLSPLALAWSKRLFKYHVLTDILNASIIVLFFLDKDLRSLLSSIVDIPVEFNPWKLPSPTQAVAILSRLLLILITYHMVKNMVKLYGR